MNRLSDAVIHGMKTVGRRAYLAVSKAAVQICNIQMMLAASHVGLETNTLPLGLD
jgi:hypothetical protein